MNTRLVILWCASSALSSLAAQSSNSIQALPIVHKDSFDHGAKAWLPSDIKKWTVDRKEDGNQVYHLHGKSNYRPPHRSPHSISLLADKVVGDFVLTARVQTLQTTRGHRDMCIFFGFQDPGHFYYVHLGEKPDPHSSQIFIVNGAPRTKITETADVGIPWKTGEWHQVKVVRKVKDGLIEVYFDDMTKPQKVAHDVRFKWGAIGLGSFDDLGLWDDIELRGVTVDRLVDQGFGRRSQPFVAVKASPETKQHATKNVLDGNAMTTWSTVGPGALTLELRQISTVGRIQIGFPTDGVRTLFEIQTSLDGKDFSKRGTHKAREDGAVHTYELQKSKARFVRIVLGEGASIHTVSLPKPPKKPKPGKKKRK